MGQGLKREDWHLVGKGRGGPGLARTHLPAIHVQQDHVPHIVSRDHHSAFDRYVQAAEPDAGGRDCAVRLLGTEASCIYSLLQLMSHAQQTVNKYPLSE